MHEGTVLTGNSAPVKIGDDEAKASKKQHDNDQNWANMQAIPLPSLFHSCLVENQCGNIFLKKEGKKRQLSKGINKLRKKFCGIFVAVFNGIYGH